jgi:26S proteasome regulatory subunit N2
VGLNAAMQMPKFEATVNCKPATFAYPAPIIVDKKEEVSKVPTAVLSTTAKAKERAKLKKQEADKKGKGVDTMETDEAKPSASEGAKGEEGKVEAPPIDLPGPYSVENPFRVVPSQVKFVSFKSDSR